jgi:hypothetical protein
MKATGTPDITLGLHIFGLRPMGSVTTNSFTSSDLQGKAALARVAAELLRVQSSAKASDQ